MPRKLEALGKDAPTVESSLDNFIARANDELVDVSDFNPTKAAERELALKRQVDVLEQRLAKAQVPRKKPSQGWGKLVIGYVLGCASIFAVSALMPKDSPAPQPATAVSAPPAVQPPAPAPVPTVTPIEVPTPPVAAPTPAAPVADVPVTEPPPPAVTKKARRPVKTQPSAPPQPAAGSGSDGLYNPF